MSKQELALLQQSAKEIGLVVGAGTVGAFVVIKSYVDSKMKALTKALTTDEKYKIETFKGIH